MNNFGAARMVWLMLGSSFLLVAFLLAKGLLSEAFLDLISSESIFVIYSIFTIYNIVLLSAIIGLRAYSNGLSGKIALLIIALCPIVGTIGIVDIYIKSYEHTVCNYKEKFKRNHSEVLLRRMIELLSVPFVVAGFLFLMLMLCIAQALSKNVEYRTFEDEFYAS